ncbi:MAG: tripartite tricarboxylate transporter substrate binding protein [Candidatus Protistobacter heckmanni]|nr:tripartite tricarboxylate transporter substrate binding protein [Candidatus Protistobacter heckmanni]
MKRLALALCACLLAALTTSLHAADAVWPSKPIRIIISFSPGALTDVIARMYGNELSKRLNVPVIVENNAGAGGVIASQNLAASAPDGYTLLFVSSGHAVNPALKKSLPFNTTADFAGVALVASSPTLVITNGNSSFKSFGDLIDFARKKPGVLNYGSAGVGSATHLAGEYLLMEACIKMNHIPYKGVQEAVSEVFAARIDTAFPPIALALPFIRDGRLRALAITGSKRSELLPAVPTVAELGYKDFDYGIWYAFVTRAGVPKPILTRMAGEIRKISEMPEIQAKMKSQGLELSNLELGEFDKYIASEMSKFSRIVKAAGIQPD